MSASIRVSLAEAADNEAAREERARAAAEIIRDARGYRWVGIYDVGDDQISIVAHTGSAPPEHSSFGIDQGLSGEAVRTRATVVSGSEAIVPILGAESGLVIGTLDVEGDPIGAFLTEDIAFLEDCAAVLRPLYD